MWEKKQPCSLGETGDNGKLCQRQIHLTRSHYDNPWTLGAQSQSQNVSVGICNPSIGEKEAGGSQGHWHGGLTKMMISKLKTPCLKNKAKSDKKKIQSDL